VKRSEIRRTPMRSKGGRDTGPTPETVKLVVARDYRGCALCGSTVQGHRGWDWSVQHRMARKGGGTVRAFINLPGNLVLLCGSGTVGCHFRVESNGLWARENGFKVREGVTLPADTPIEHAVHGRVLLADDGTWTPERAP
jgi:hypothetical protein